MSPALVVAIGAVRAWTHVYTVGMHPVLRERRCAEIDSDLWEFHEDARRRRFSPAAIAVLMLMRLALGVQDDLAWRVEHRTLHFDLVREVLWTTAIASVAVLWFVIGALQTKEPPLSPVGTGNIVRMLYPVHMYPAPLPPAPFPASADIVVRVSLTMMPPPPPPPPKRHWK